MAFAKKGRHSQSRSQSRYLNNQMQIGSQSRHRVEMQCAEYIILCHRVESPYTTGVGAIQVKSSTTKSLMYGTMLKALVVLDFETFLDAIASTVARKRVIM